MSINPFEPSEVVLGNFLVGLSGAREIQASSVSKYRTAIEQVWAVLGNRAQTNSTLVNRIMRGLRRGDPVKARYEDSYDISRVLDWIGLNWADTSSLTMNDLRAKVVLLIRITSLKRSKDVAMIIRDTIKLDPGSFSFRMLGEKKIRDGSIQLTQAYPLFDNPADPARCPVVALREYLRRTEGLVREKISEDFPHEHLVLRLTPSKGTYGPVGSQYISKICVGVLRSAGIPDHFKSHSLRLAAATKLLNSGVEVEDVMKIGGWTSRQVFDKFYNRKRIRADIGQLMDQPDES